MAPKVQFSKEQIIQAAFDFSVKNGLSSLTVRKLAEKLGCSVAPIYVNFKNSGELLQAVIEKIKIKSWEYSTKNYTEKGFYNIGIGQLLFARDFPILYQNLLELSPASLEMPNDIKEKMLEIMYHDPMLEGLSKDQCKTLLFMMSQFTNGVSLSLVKKWVNLPVPQCILIMEEMAHRLVGSMRSQIDYEPALSLEELKTL